METTNDPKALYPGLAVQDKPYEAQTYCGWYDDPRKENGFIDLRPFGDDKTVLRNPHKGWFWHFIDNGYRSPVYRDRIPEGSHMEEFPGLTELLLRVDWADIEKEEGVYDFGFMDRIMDEWSAYGYRFFIRACTYETTPGLELATPEYVFKKGARCYMPNGRSVQPDYGDPYYLERLEAFLKVLGEKYNGDSRVDYIDVGTYGTWGEGHTVEGDGVIYPEEVVRRHIDLHLKYFPDRHIVINDDHIMGRLLKGDECQDILDYAYERGIGIVDDSICCDYYSVVNGYDTMRANWAFEKLSKNAPCSIEFAHYSYIHPTYEHYYRNGLTIVECLKNSHASYAGFHGYPQDFLRTDKWLAEYCANRLGYWYFMPSAVVPELTATAHNSVYVTVHNKGWAKAYEPHKLWFALLGADGTERVLETENRVDGLDSEESMRFHANLDLRGLPEGEYEVCVGVFEGDEMINLALKEELRRGGFYRIARRTVRGV